MKHTKTPWALHLHQEYDIIRITGEHGDICMPSGPTDEIILANAKYIVKCVNNHENLVEALKAIYNQQIDNRTSKYTWIEAMSLTKQALKYCQEE